MRTEPSRLSPVHLPLSWGVHGEAMWGTHVGAWGGEHRGQTEEVAEQTGVCAETSAGNEVIVCLGEPRTRLNRWKLKETFAPGSPEVCGHQVV